MSYIQEHIDMACDLNEELKCTLTLMRELDLEIDSITTRCETRVSVLEKHQNVVTPEFSEEECKAIGEQYSKAKEIAVNKVELAERMEFLVKKYIEKLDKDLQQCRNDLEAECEGLAASIEKRCNQSDKKRRPRKKLLSAASNTSSHEKLPKLGEPSDSYENIQPKTQLEKKKTEPTDSIKPKKRHKKKKTKPSYSKLEMSKETPLSQSVTNDTINPTTFEKLQSPTKTAKQPGGKLKPYQLSTSQMTGKVKPQPQTSGNREKSCHQETKTTASTQSQTNCKEESKLPKQQSKASVSTWSQTSGNKENKSSKQKKKPTVSVQSQTSSNTEKYSQEQMTAKNEKFPSPIKTSKQPGGNLVRWKPFQLGTSQKTGKIKPSKPAQPQISGNTENNSSEPHKKLTSKEQMRPTASAQVQTKGKGGNRSSEQMKPTVSAQSQTSSNTEKKCSKQQITAKNEPSELAPAQTTGKTYSSESKITTKRVKQQAMCGKLVTSALSAKVSYIKRAPLAKKNPNE